MLVQFTTTETDSTTSPIILAASNSLSARIWSGSLMDGIGATAEGVHMKFGKTTSEGLFQFVWELGRSFTIEEIKHHVRFPGLLSCEAYEPGTVEPAESEPAESEPAESEPAESELPSALEQAESIIARVGRTVRPGGEGADG